MDIYFDLNSKSLWIGAVGESALQPVKIRQYEDLRVKFVRGTVAELLEVSATISIRLKLTKEAAVTLASTSAFTRPAASTDFYTGTLSLNTTQIVTDIFDVANSADELVVFVEMEWAPAADASLVRKSDDAKITLVRSVATGSESAATDATASVALATLTSITALTGGTATCLDAVATVGVTAGRLITLVISDVLQIWQLKAGTEAEDESAGIIRPDDYNASTNAKYWIQRL